jgi:hypothetical protein
MADPVDEFLAKVPARERAALDDRLNGKNLVGFAAGKDHCLRSQPGRHGGPCDPPERFQDEQVNPRRSGGKARESAHRGERNRTRDVTS